MNYTIELLEDDNYDLNDKAEPEYDLKAIREQARIQGREYRGMLSGQLVRLAPDVSTVFNPPS